MTARGHVAAAGERHRPERRRPERHRPGRLLGASALAVALAGCATSDPATEPSPGPAELSADEVYQQIDLAGTADDRPLIWRFEPSDDPSTADAVTVAQHYVSLLEALYAPDLPSDDDLALLPYLATDAEAERVAGIASSATTPTALDLTGPRWYTVLAAETEKDEALVVLCSDVGYWTEQGTDGDPRADGERASVRAYRLVAPDGSAGGPPWRVDRVAYDNVEFTDGSPALTGDQMADARQRCEDWATHTIDDH